MRPTIFLDIDGVLATTHQYYTNRKKWHEMYDCYRFDEKCVKVFNDIIEKAGDPSDVEYGEKFLKAIEQIDALANKITKFGKEYYEEAAKYGAIALMTFYIAKMLIDVFTQN